MAAENSKSRPRPRLFRALGDRQPPDELLIDGQPFRHERTIKHDSWAATAFYTNDSQRVVCKFNRTEPILYLSTRWLGRRLAGRESAMYRRLSDLPNIATGYDEVYSSDGQLLCNAAAHDYIEGHPLRWHDRVHDDFFEQLLATLHELHRRDIAYVDLNKWENIIVDQVGNPALIDFQISVKLPRRWPLSTLLKVLQKSDLYHVAKHASRIRPDLYDPDLFPGRPWWIRMHRCIGNPFRAFRRKLLVLFGVRKGKGKAQSEQFVEEGLRETIDESKPILRLYELLGSRRYFDYATGSNRTFVDTTFVELVNRPPLTESEIKLTKHLQNHGRHEQLVALLKSPVFFCDSDKWDDARIEKKIALIASRLPPLENATRAAA